MTYTAVLFDLFDTLVRFDRDRMPEIQVNGRTVRSTAGHLHQVLRLYAPEISLEACYEALVESWREAERLRAIDYREVPAPERFGDFFRRLARRYRLAVVSNFDYTPTAVDILEREGVARRFSAIVVSDAVGWRKPKREIFDEALRRMDQSGGRPASARDHAAPLRAPRPRGPRRDPRRVTSIARNRERI